MKVHVHSSIEEIPACDWDALVRDDYPFLKHAFLAAIERNKCVGADMGWIPYHLSCSIDGKLAGAMPLYIKTNSWGEFVFDHAWAEAYNHFGLDYYPKLVNSIPFTPITGQRLLAEQSQNTRIFNAFVDKIDALLRNHGFSSFHSLFPSNPDYDVIKGKGFISRMDYQFIWQNRGYTNFQDFLDSLRRKKRKNIQQERRRVYDSNIHIRVIPGSLTTGSDWHEFNKLYEMVYRRKWGMPAFNPDFFIDIARDLGDQVILLRADQDGHFCAGALFLRDNATLYGRHWACDRFINALHFELCYYQGIELCIQWKLDHFNPGVQGKHKLARGFLPVKTKSLHRMLDGPLLPALKQFSKQEAQYTNDSIQSLLTESPYNNSQTET